MKLFRSSLLLMGSLAAFSWFLLKRISFPALLPLIPLGVLFYFLFHFIAREQVILNGMTALITLGLISYVVSVGVFQGHGFWMLVFLLIGCAFFATKIKASEWARISGWWMTLFLLIFLAMLIATAVGAKQRMGIPDCGRWSDVLIFYLLAFFEPFTMGEKYRAAPLSLGILLIPFGFFSYLALGSGAFCAAEYPYLSVLSGVSLAAFHHLEGIILCFLFGAGILRLSNFIIRYNSKKNG